MIVIKAYKVMGHLVVKLTSPGAKDSPSARSHEPVPLATHTALLWDEMQHEQIAQVVSMLLRAMPEYEWQIEDLL